MVSLAYGSSSSVLSYPGCVVNGVKFLTHRRDINRTTQNCGVSVKGPDDQVYYGQVEDIYELIYGGNNSVFLFKCKWFKTNLQMEGRRRGVKQYKNQISICIKDVWYENEPFILASQAEQVFYVDDLYNGSEWKVVEHFGHRHIWDFPHADTDDAVIVQEIESSGIELFVELPNVDSMSWNEPSVPSVPSDIAMSDVRGIIEPTQDDFINDDEEDETLDQYVEENEDNEEGEDREGDDDDYDDGDDDDDMEDEGMRGISSDDE